MPYNVIDNDYHYQLRREIETLEKTYDNWWRETKNGDQEMEDGHQVGWQKIIRQLDEKEITDQRVLDFGCNQGGFLRTLYETYPFSSGIGVDLAKKAIEVAKLRQGGYPISYYQTGDILSLGEVFDVVMSTSVLYLIEDLPAHFKMISAVLAEQGVYYASFTDMTKNPSFEYMREKIDRYGATKMQNKSLTEVVDELLAAGFSVELRKEQTESVYDVTEYHNFYQSVDDYILGLENSYLIKAVKMGGIK